MLAFIPACDMAGDSKQIQTSYIEKDLIMEQPNFNRAKRKNSKKIIENFLIN